MGLLQNMSRCDMNLMKAGFKKKKKGKPKWKRKEEEKKKETIKRIFKKRQMEEEDEEQVWGQADIWQDWNWDIQVI